MKQIANSIGQSVFNNLKKCLLLFPIDNNKCLTQLRSVKLPEVQRVAVNVKMNMV